MNSFEIGDLVQLSDEGRRIKGTPWNIDEVGIVTAINQGRLNYTFVTWTRSGDKHKLANIMLKKL
jgi:hypothetical protein